MTEAARKIEDFGTRDEYYRYRQQLAQKALLAFGIVLQGRPIEIVLRVQGWTQEALNLNDDDMITAHNNLSDSSRFTRSLRLPRLIPTEEALPPAEDEQIVVALVQRIADGVDGVHELISSEVAELRVPSSTTAAENAWNERSAAFFRERDAAYQARL